MEIDPNEEARLSDNGGPLRRLLIVPACVLVAVATGAMAIGPNLAFHPLPLAGLLLAQSVFGALFCSDANRSAWQAYEDGQASWFESRFAEEASGRRLAFLCGLFGTWMMLGTFSSALWAWVT